MGLANNIKNRDLKGLEKTVAEAVKIYNADKPAETSVDTAHGALPLSAVFDEDTKWNVITAAYATIVQDVSKLPKDCDIKVETAKLIATNAILRNITADPKAGADGLL